MSARPPPSGLEAELARAARVLWLFDYDGTLVPFAARPELAVPDLELRELLAKLASKPRMRVHIVSGRAHEVLESWFGTSDLGLHGDHGLWSRPPGGAWVLNSPIDTGWKDLARAILKDFFLRTPGALFEEKSASLAFHYREVDPQLGQSREQELSLRLAPLLEEMPVEILRGHKMLELRPRGVNKGMVVQKIIDMSSPTLLVAAGDDETDEQLFRALPADAWSIRIGAQPTAARFSLPHVEAMRELLRAAVTAS